MIVLDFKQSSHQKFNDAHKEKPPFTEFRTRIYWNKSLGAFELFYMFRQQISSVNSVVKEDRFLKKVIHQIDRKWTVALFEKF